MIVWWLLLYAPSLVVLAGSRASASRRLLGVSLALAIPLAGPVLAVVVVRVRGKGMAERAPKPAGPRPPWDASDAVRRMAGQPSVLDRLLSAAPSERLAALVELSERSDATAIRVLRWAIEYGRGAAVLDAALALEQLELRLNAEREETAREARERPSVARAARAARAAQLCLDTGLIDRGLAARVADDARSFAEMAAAGGNGAAVSCGTCAGSS